MSQPTELRPVPLRLPAAPGFKPLPDDLLEYAIRMFLPDAPGVDYSKLCREAIAYVRDPQFVKSCGMPAARARWYANCPLYLAHRVMMFGHQEFVQNPKYCGWWVRVRELMKERERRHFSSGGEGHE